MKRATLSAINEARRSRQAAALLLDETEGVVRLVLEPEFANDPLGKELEALRHKGRSQWIGEGDERLFCRIYVPEARLVVIGAVHIAQALAHYNQALGFALDVIDPRGAFSTEARFPGTSLTSEWPDVALTAKPLDPYTALLAITHDPKIDDPALSLALQSQCFYIGALGSRRTHKTRCERLGALGFSEADLARIEAPIGLDLGAVGPEEIALSIMASLVKKLRQGA